LFNVQSKRLQGFQWNYPGADRSNKVFSIEWTQRNILPLPYLKDPTPGGYDIHLTVELQSEKMTTPQVISNTNFKYLYWSMKQQLTHHTITGCAMSSGDLLGSGTVSGPTDDSLGSMLEVSWKGTRSLKLNESGEERKFLQDGDTVIMKAECRGEGYKIGFGSCVGKILPPWNP